MPNGSQARTLKGAEPSSRQGKATLQHVLDTSTQLFSERGFAATSMRQLAERAGLPISAFYYYFSGKYDVLTGIIETSIGDCQSALEDAHDPTATADARLHQLVRTHVLYHVQHPVAAHVADSEMRSLEPGDLRRVLKQRRTYEQPFRDALEAGVKSGVFSKDLDVTIATNLILTMSTGVIYWFKPGGKKSSQQVADRIADYAVQLARSS